MIKIVVCAKVIAGELNPFDECALEEALRIPDAEVTVVSMCPPSAKDKLLSLTRLGVKRVILLSDRVFAGSDTLATSYILSCQMKKMNPDLIFCGRQTVDGDTAQVGPCLATLLGIPYLTNVMKICGVGEKIECETRFGKEEAPLPALLTIERINTLRFPSIRSRVGEIEIIGNDEVGADVRRCGLSGSPTKVRATFENRSGKRKCSFIDASEFCELLEKLRNSPRHEAEVKKCETKLPSVWAIGKEVVEKSEQIAEKVVLIEEREPKKIAALIREGKPGVVLFPADLYGRRTAPAVSAMLETGLCADCTALETDGEKLFMYRPAKSGNIIAKIECRTLPQMATVRCSEASDNVIVAGGAGVIGQTDKLAKFAHCVGAELGASRVLVDRGGAEYSAQVGLTGKNVSPRVYVAIGISGAVQHVCAIENAGYVIAVNPDRNAPIFEYADYGIVSTFEDFFEKTILR